MCKHCEYWQQQPNSGAVGGVMNWHCVECMARLIRSARPMKGLQNAHIAAMARFHGQEWGEEVWAQVRELLKRG